MGLGTFCILAFLELLIGIPYIEYISSFLPPIIAGIFSDDDTWFWAGFLTIFISSVLIGYIFAFLFEVHLFLIFEYPALWLFGLLTIPIIAVFAAVVGGILGFLGRVIGESLGMR